ncbi:MAG: alpha-L-rhamnosidase N-terminal domain-containing protein, partial [Streptosporangiaceae bacterium]
MTTPSPLIPAGLRCAHLVNPLGVASDRVRLSWMLEGARTGRAQRAYQVLVVRDEARLSSGENLSWDSGQVESSCSTDIAYGGVTLAPGARYVWKVRAWDERGLVSDWSEPAAFEVELDGTAGWHASWIGQGRAQEKATPPDWPGPVDAVARTLTPAPYLRRSFTVDQSAASARLYVTALGLYEARLNGQRVGDGFLTPGWTDYTRRILYQTYDVTSLLAGGENVLAAILAHGWYAGFVGFDAKRAGAHYGAAPELLAQLLVTYPDGRRQWIVTDEQWESSAGAIRHADLLMGERYDLALEPHGWDLPGFNAAHSDGPHSGACGAGGAGGWRPVRC